MRLEVMKPGKKFFLILIATASFLAMLIGAMLYGSLSGVYSGEAETIKIGTARLESSALIYIAESKGFFSRNGLDAIVQYYDTGAASLNGLLKGEIDIATPAEYALVGKAFQKEDIRAIASIDEVQYFHIIGRKDLGIEKITDLKGKKIGVVTKTIAEFYLGRFLKLHGIDIDQVSLVDVDISQSEKAIMRGDVDAIMCRSPYASAIQKQLGVNAVSWPAQSSQALYAIMIGRSDWLSAHNELVKRLLNSLLQAEEFLVHHPYEARSIIRERMNFDEAHMSAIWSQNHFSLSLDQSLILAMEDEARWMINNGLTTEKVVPDFVNYIHTDSLETVKPEAVSIIH